MPWGRSVSGFSYNEVIWVSSNGMIRIMKCVLCSNETLIAGVRPERSHMTVPTKRYMSLPSFCLQAGYKSFDIHRLARLEFLKYFIMMFI